MVYLERESETRKTFWKRQKGSHQIVQSSESKWGRVQNYDHQEIRHNGSESQKIQVSKQKLLESLDLIHQK